MMFIVVASRFPTKRGINPRMFRWRACSDIEDPDVGKTHPTGLMTS